MDDCRPREEEGCLGRGWGMNRAQYLLSRYHHDLLVGVSHSGVSATRRLYKALCPSKRFRRLLPNPPFFYTRLEKKNDKRNTTLSRRKTRKKGDPSSGLHRCTLPGTSGNPGEAFVIGAIKRETKQLGGSLMLPVDNSSVIIVAKKSLHWFSENPKFLVDDERIFIFSTVNRTFYAPGFVFIVESSIVLLLYQDEFN